MDIRTKDTVPEVIGFTAFLFTFFTKTIVFIVGKLSRASHFVLWKLHFGVLSKSILICCFFAENPHKYANLLGATTRILKF